MDYIEYIFFPQKHNILLYCSDISGLHFYFFFFKTDPLLNLLPCPAPDDPTHLTRHQVIKVVLYIEWSGRLILEDAYNPATQSPLHDLLFISVYVTYSPAHCFRQYWQLLFTFISPNCSKPWYTEWSKWVETKRTQEEESSKMFSLFLGIIAWMVGVLLAQALMENILKGVFFQLPQIISGAIH